jgi:hypothetical protein
MAQTMATYEHASLMYGVRKLLTDCEQKRTAIQSFLSRIKDWIEEGYREVHVRKVAEGKKS